MGAVVMGQGIAFLLQGQDEVMFWKPVHCQCWMKEVERKRGTGKLTEFDNLDIIWSSWPLE